MSLAEVIIFWMTIFTYVGTFCFLLFGSLYQKDKIIKFSRHLFIVGFVIHSALVLVRWAAGGHPPVTDVYELNLLGTWFTVLVFLIFEGLGKADKAIGLVVIPVVFLVLGYGFVLRSEAAPMGPAFKSPWLGVHVIFAWLAFGCYTVAFGASLLYLLKAKYPSWKTLSKVTSLESLDLTSYRFIVLGFINQAVMLVSGAIWAKSLWGHYWSWDALETWSLIAFLYYAFYLHTRSFLKWKNKRAAWVSVIGLVVLAISFWGVELFGPSVHPEI
jgi:cytochrome c-type biogenesis protein CcsB